MAKKKAKRVGCPTCGGEDFGVSGTAWVEAPAEFVDDGRGPSYEPTEEYSVEIESVTIRCYGCGAEYDEDMRPV